MIKPKWQISIQESLNHRDGPQSTNKIYMIKPKWQLSIQIKALIMVMALNQPARFYMIKPK
jgi:hypothetical protein